MVHSIYVISVNIQIYYVFDIYYMISNDRLKYTVNGIYTYTLSSHKSLACH